MPLKNKIPASNTSNASKTPQNTSLSVAFLILIAYSIPLLFFIKAEAALTKIHQTNNFLYSRLPAASLFLHHSLPDSAAAFPKYKAALSASDD